MKVLIVVDMQNDFIDGALGTKEAVSVVENVSSKIKNFDGRIIYTRDTHEEDYLNTQEGRNLPVKHCIKGTEGWEISKALPVSEDAVIFDKPTFGSKELADYLKGINDAEGIDEIELIGVCTDICVISNALLIISATVFLCSSSITLSISITSRPVASPIIFAIVVLPQPGIPVRMMFWFSLWSIVVTSSTVAFIIFLSKKRL